MKKDWKPLVGAALLSVAVVVAIGSSALGQGPPRGGSGYGPPGGGYRGRGPSDGGYRGRGPSDGGYRGSYGGDDQSRLERYLGFITNLDTNKNGQIDENEAEGGRRYFVSRLAERAKVEVKFPLSIKKLQDGLRKNYSSGGDGSTSGSGGSSNSKDKKDTGKPVLVPSFGVETDTVDVLKFGEVPPSDSGSSRGSGGSARASSQSGSSSTRSSSHSSGGEADERVRRWAEAMMRQYDRNHNGRLEKDEWSKMRGNPEESDRNHDGVLTLDELTDRLRKYSQSRSSDRGSGSKDSRGSSKDRSISNAWGDRKSFRFLTTAERLPDGLPDWFAEKDANGDGQVAMAEYATFWTISAANNFSRCDLNNDGMVTPEECLAAEAASEDEPPGSASVANKPPAVGKKQWSGFGDE